MLRMINKYNYVDIANLERCTYKIYVCVTG